MKTVEELKELTPSALDAHYVKHWKYLRVIEKIIDYRTMGEKKE